MRLRSNTEGDADKSGDSVGGVQRKVLDYMMLLACLFCLGGERWWWWMAGNGMGGEDGGGAKGWRMDGWMSE